MSKRKLSDDDNSTLPPAMEVFTSSSIHDRDSTFTAIFSPSHSALASPSSLQAHPPFTTATHKILAWRKPSAQRSLTASFSSASSQPGNGHAGAKVLYETGSDEDGEKYAGKKVEKVLNDLNVVGVVVVARWYGGVLLGPVRFKWIEDVAIEAVGKWKVNLAAGERQGGMDGSGIVKKAKSTGGEVVGKEMFGGSHLFVDDVKEKERLLRVLKERDESVSILRGLLVEKNQGLRKLDEGRSNDSEHSEKVQSPSTKTPEYDAMSVARLKSLEKARDATLSWILKQIDQVEEKINDHGKVKEGS